MCAPSCPTHCDPMDCGLPGSYVHGFSRHELWNGLPFSPPRNFLDPEIEPMSLASPTLAGTFCTTGATWEAHGLN